jgi:cystine transport system substrate-binding protein
LPLAAFAFAVLTAPAVGGANPSHGVASLRANDAAIAAKSRAAVLDLYSLDHRLSAASSRLASLKRQAMSLRAERASLQRQIRVAQRGTRLGQSRLADRIRALYDQGNVEPLEIVFGAKSLDEAMTNLENLNRAAGQGEAVLAELKAAKHKLAAASRQLATRQSALAAATREAQATQASLERARAQRSAYISTLATQRRMTQQEIAAAVVRAQAAVTRTTVITRAGTTQAIAASAPPVALDTAVSSSAGHTLTVSATGYALGGTTATGLPVGWGIVAVDPSVIPLGTHMTVPGYGEAVAADTGGAIIGATIDLWFPSVAQANAWGRRTVTIVLH